MFNLLSLFSFWGNMSWPSDGASVVSSGLGAYPTVFYDRVAVSTIQSNLFLYPACERKQMPNRSGVAMQIFNYTKMSANTTAATEGVPGAGLTLTQNTRTINLSNYVDYITISHKVDKTALTDVLAEGAKLLAYRGALSVDTVISTAVDTAANSDSATLINVTHGSYMTSSIARRAVHSLRGADIKPKDNGMFYGVINGLVSYDLLNDSNAGGFQDYMRYVQPKAIENGIPATNRVATIGGAEWYESNALPTQTNWQSSSSTAYFNYVFGKDAFFASDLGDTQLGQKNFTVKVSRFTPNSSAYDPATMIAAAASYNFFFGVSKTPGSTNRFRRIAVEASIT